MHICLVGTYLFHADGQTDSEGANRSFTQFCRHT